MAQRPPNASLAPSASSDRDAHSGLIRVLHVEDSEVDHEVLMAHLRRGGLQVACQRVETGETFLSALHAHPWDVVIADYNLPGFTGLQALDLLRASSLLIPFIIVSGEIGEETAVEAMRNGASDYLLKHNLARLQPAVLNAIEANQAQLARREAALALAESERRLHELAQHLQSSVELERTSIAREIHDDVGGSLTAVKFDLAWIGRRVQDPALADRVRSALETLDHAIGASQRIMHNLRPAVLDQGLVAALQWMTQNVEQRTGIHTVFRTTHEQIRLAPSVALTIYRTAQEALTNIAKHAEATRVRVDLTLANNTLSLEVSDNGRGIGPQDLAKARSFGIRGLHERAHTLNGWLDISSGTQGTTLILSVPVRKTESEPEKPGSTVWGDIY